MTDNGTNIQPPQPIMIHDVNEFLSEIFSIGQQIEGGVKFYRGQADASWEIKSTLDRFQGPKDIERTILRELMLDSPEDFNSDRTMFDRLVRARHYGLPARIIDVTLNPLVALFFACHEDEHFTANGKVSIFEIAKSFVKYADDDEVSLFSNLANLSDSEKENLVYLANHSLKLTLEDSDQRQQVASIENFQSSTELFNLIHFVNQEKYFVGKLILPAHLAFPLFVFSRKNNSRIAAQSGAFLMEGTLETFFSISHGSMRSNKNGETILLRNDIEVNTDCKRNILKQLDILGINRKTLFPGIESYIHYLKEKHSSI